MIGVLCLSHSGHEMLPVPERLRVPCEMLVDMSAAMFSSVS
jgi:hypothetical protein